MSSSAAPPGSPESSVVSPGTISLREPAHQVAPAAKVLWGISAVIRSVVLLVLVLGAELFGFGDLPWWGWVLGAALALTYVAVMPVVRYRIHRWESTETAVYTQVGFLSRQRQIAPMSKVQTIDMDESPVARLLGLATVSVTTASAMGSLTITAIRRDTAQQLVSELTQRTEAEADDAT